jgi:hypothetical protein
LEAQAVAAGQSIFAAVVENARINFQNFDDLKCAFRVSYGIKLGELGVGGDVLAELRRLIGYRHRIVHVSPLLANAGGGGPVNLVLLDLQSCVESSWLHITRMRKMT